MRKILILLLASIGFMPLIAQKKEPVQKIVFKTEIQPLINNSKISDALPLVKRYFEQNLILGEIWNPKVMILEANNMYLSEKLLAVNHDEKAFIDLSVAHADSSIFWYQRMLKDRHQDSLLAKGRINVLLEAKNQFPIQLVEKQKQKEIQTAKRNKIIADSLELVRAEKEKRELFVKDSLLSNQKIQVELDDYLQSKKANKINAYKSFLKKYPESEYYIEIDTLCSKLGMRKADSIHTFQSYKEFLDSFPTSTFVSEVTDKMLKLVCPQNPSSLKSLTEVNKIINEIRLLDKKVQLGFDFQNRNQYSTVNLNSGNWTFKNLNVSHFSNGDTIPQVLTSQEWEKASKNKKPAWCYYENNPENQYVYGKLYNWYAVTDPRGLTTSNYVIPSLELFESLIVDGGGSKNAFNNLKCLDSWQDAEYSDESIGFDAVPSGYRDDKGNFLDKDKSCGFWSSNDNGEDAYFVGLDNNANSNNSVFNSKVSKGFGFSIRLVLKYEDSEYEYSELLYELLNKRDELLLKEYGLIKDERKINGFLLNQLRNELGIKYLGEDEIDNAHFNSLISRFYKNEDLEKNGMYFIPPYRSEQSSCGSDGAEDVSNLEIIHGFKSNTHNFIKWSDGSTYTGEILDGSPNGKGVLIIGANCIEIKNRGNILEGNFVDGYMASGVIKYKDKRVYQGACNSNNEPNGNGTMIFANGTKQSGEFKDGIYHKTIQIGNQIWMDKNLDVTTFRDGTPIKQVNNNYEWLLAINNQTPAWCYENFDPNKNIIYNFYVLYNKKGLEVAPIGWHIPDFNEFNAMGKYVASQKARPVDCQSEFLGYNETGRKQCEYEISEFLRSSSGWAKTYENSYNKQVPFLIGKDAFGLGLKANYHLKNEFNNYSSKQEIVINKNLFECVLWSRDKRCFMWEIGEKSMKPIQHDEDANSNQQTISYQWGNSIRCIRD